MIKRITTYTKCLNYTTLGDLCKLNNAGHAYKTAQPNLTLPALRSFHFTPNFHKKIFIDLENAYAYKILPPMATIQPPPVSAPVTTVEDFEKLLNHNWRQSNIGEIVAAFDRVKNVCISHNITLSDHRFDRLVDGLMDHCEKLSDDQLLRLLEVISEYPPCEGVNSHNFHDVWSCLDDICCWKLAKWDVEKMYVFANAWYKLNLGKVSDYVFEVLDKMPKKAKKLDKAMLLYTYFHVNVCRKRAVDFEVEHALAEKIGEFSVEELAVVAMGYFKTRTKIKLKRILVEMMEKVGENRESVDDIALTAILKAIRLTQNIETVDALSLMLDKLVDQIPRLSTLSVIHLALVGTGLQLLHEPTLTKCTERIVNEIETIRLKDIERILLVNSMFNQDSVIYRKAFEEIHQERRRKEMVQYNRCLPCALNYLSQRKIYSSVLTNEVLDEEYIDEVYGKSAANLPRELFSLDACVEIELPGYQGNRLSVAKKYKAAKWLTDFTPAHDQPKKVTLSDAFYLDVVKHLAEHVGGERCLRCDHVLPHFSKSDVILCRDRTNGRFMEPYGFENYILGDIKRPFDVDKYEWLAVVILTPNQTIRNRTAPLGAQVMKQRQLRAVGYTPIFIFWNEWATLDTAGKSALVTRALA